MVAVVPFPYVVTRPTQVREKRCLPTKSLQINDSTSRIRINYQIFKVASKTPSYVQIVQLFCKTGYFLALNVTAKKNRIIGIVNQSSESSKSVIILTSLPSPRGECKIKCIILLVILFQVVTWNRQNIEYLLALYLHYPNFSCSYLHLTSSVVWLCQIIFQFSVFWVPVPRNKHSETAESCQRTVSGDQREGTGCYSG